MKIEKSVDYYNNGNIWHEGWHKEGNEYQCHREDGPAYVVYYYSGEKEFEVWCVHNKKHKVDGPAFISYNKDGTVRFEKYYINGERLSKEEWEDHPIRQEYIIKEAMKKALE